MMKTSSGAAAVGAMLWAVAGASTARADILYDSISGLESQGSLITSDSEWSQQLRLADGAPLVLSEVRLSLWCPSLETYRGTLWVTLYEDAGDAPGVRISRQEMEVSVPSREDTVIAVPFEGVELPGRGIWLSFFMDNIPANSPGLNFTRSEPLVGETSGICGRRPWGSEEEWSIALNPVDPFMIQVVSVPAPAAAVMLGVLAIGGTRRRG